MKDDAERGDTVGVDDERCDEHRSRTACVEQGSIDAISPEPCGHSGQPLQLTGRKAQTGAHGGDGGGDLDTHTYC